MQADDPVGYLLKCTDHCLVIRLHGDVVAGSLDTLPTQRSNSTAEPAVREILEDIVKIGDPTILDYILQVAKHRR
jgi:hypothetical protein